jgi:hypothetical protein
MRGANRLCIARGVLSSVTFHSSAVRATLAVVKIFSSRTHPVRALSTPSVRKSEAMAVTLVAMAANATPRQDRALRLMCVTGRY